MSDLEDGPDHFVLFLSLVRSILGVLELVGKFEQGVFDVFEAIRWRLAVSGATNWRHFGLRVGARGDEREVDGQGESVLYGQGDSRVIDQTMAGIRKSRWPTKKED
jgi:hypothetical protein